MPYGVILSAKLMVVMASLRMGFGSVVLVPAYYPDVITLFASECSAQQLLRIRSLIETPRNDARAVKDSFSSLELSGLGFRLLFDAHWIGVNTDNSTLARLPPRYSVDPVQTMPELSL